MMGFKSDSKLFKETNGTGKNQTIQLDLQLFAKLPENKSQIMHIFRDDEGHFIDNDINRNLLINLTNDDNSFLGIDENGINWYAKNLSDGRQLWVTVKDNIIQNGGINEEHIEFTPKKGLKRHNKRRKNI